MFVFPPFRWFKDWGIKMTSEKEQRKQRREQIGDNLECEFLAVGHSERKENKVITTIKPTACARSEDLCEKIATYVEKNDK